MSRDLPVYQFGDEKFYVDLDHWQFRQVDNPANTISLDRLRDKNDHTLLRYDKRTKNAFIGGRNAFNEAGDNVIEIKLPPAGRLDYEKAQALVLNYLRSLRNGRTNEPPDNKLSKRNGKGKKI